MRRSAKRLQAEKCLKQGLEKKKFQLILWVSSSDILLACRGHLLLVLVNDFVIGSTVDPDLQIRGGRSYPEPELTRGGGRSQKYFTVLLRASVQAGGGGGGGGGKGRAPPGSSTEDDSPGTLPRAGKLKKKLLGQQENLLVPDYWMGPFLSRAL